MVKLPRVKCLRCGYEWVPRVENPVTCAKCKNPFWNKPKKRTLKNLRK